MISMTKADSFSNEDFRQAIGSYGSGVTLVTGRAPDGAMAGMTCQSFHSLSLDPPLVAFFARRTSRSYQTLRDLDRFCINILAQDQAGLALQFARSGGDKWRDVEWTPDAFGQPVIAGSIASFSCHRYAEYPGGDHIINVSRPESLRADPRGKPLLFFRSRFSELAEQTPTSDA